MSRVAVKKQKERDRNIGNALKEDMSKVEERLTEISERIEELKKENLEEKSKD